MAKGFPIIIVESGGVPFVQVENGASLASEADAGMAITLVESGAPGIVIEGGPTPPVEKPTILTAPTITLDGYTATIALGTFEGADSTAHELLVDGVSVGPVSAGTLDVSEYAGSTLIVRATGTNAAGSTSTVSNIIDVPDKIVTTKIKIVVGRHSSADPATGLTIYGSEAQIIDDADTNVTGTWIVQKSPVYDATTKMTDGDLGPNAISGTMLPTNLVTGSSQSDTIIFTSTAGAFTPSKFRWACPTGGSSDASCPGEMTFYYDNDGEWSQFAYFAYPTPGVRNGWGYVPETFKDFSFTPPVPVPLPDTLLWINESYLDQSRPGDLLRDRGWRGEWRDAAYHYILPRDVQKSQDTNILTDNVGSAATVKMDYDGRLYPDNGCAGLSQVMFIFPAVIPTGTYKVTLPPGLTVTPASLGGALSDFTYDSVNGDATVNIYNGDIATPKYGMIKIDVSSIPAEGVARPSIVLTGDTHPERIWTDEATANIQNMASGVRWMTGRQVNGDTLPGSTTTAFAMRSASQRWTGSVSQGARCVELAVGGANEADVGLWWNFSHLDDDELIATEGAILATISAENTVHIEWSNELWNGGFSQGYDVRLMGCRRGFAATGISMAADATPETIIDGRPLVNRNSRVTSVAFNIGDRIFVDQNGIGWLVYEALSNQAAGVTMPAGVSDANFGLIYDNTATLTAMRRYQGTRTKEIKAILDPIFEEAMRPIPIYEIGYQAATGFSRVRPVLDWDEVWKIKPHVAAAHYWGGSMGIYAGTDVAGFGEAERDLAYSDMIAHVAAFYDAAPAQVDASIAGHGADYAAVKAYVASKGDLEPNDIIVDEYEINWHVVYSGWPDRASAWSSGATYFDKAFTLGSDGKTYRAKQSVPAGKDPTDGANAAYWGVFVDSNGTTWDATNTAKYRGTSPVGQSYSFRSFAALMRAPGFGMMTTRLLDGVRGAGGGTICMFDRVFPANGPQSWGFMESEMDNDTSGGSGTNWRYKALADFKAAL